MIQRWIQAYIPAFISKEAMALKETGPESHELFGVVRPRKQGLPNFPWFSQESEDQIAAGMGLDPPQSSVFLGQCLSREAEANY